MKIGLLGFGVVGKGLYDLTLDRTDIEITKVCCLEDVQLEGTVVTKNVKDILTDETIDTVVEAMGGLHPAFEFVRDAILAGKNIVTSNKALVATFYDELLPLTKQMGVQLRCTAAVGGGISWLSELERTRRTQKVVQVGGIMNGTCNYILDSMTRLNLSYGEALSQAQALGYAEANPTTDVEGIDTWHKIIISSNVAFGISLDRESVPVTGISNISAADVENFKNHGLVCKLIATGRYEEGKYQVYVQPTLCPQGSLEAAVPSNYNLITFVGEASDRMSLYGQGAGRYPTAHNVFQDCVDVMNGKGFYSPCGEKISVVNDNMLCYYVRGNADSWLEKNKADAWGEAIITKPVTVSEMHGWLKDHPDAFAAAM